MLKEANAYIKTTYPTIASGLVTETDADLASTAGQVLEYFVRCHGSDRARFEKALDGLAQLSVDFIRLHGRFLKTGRYRATNSQAFEAELYAKPHRMAEYLDGLLMTYALWPNHARIYDFVNREFTARFPGDAEVIEIGVGHGLMAATAMRAFPARRYFGFDVSQSSLDYCAVMLKANGVQEHQYVMRRVNATHPNAFVGLGPVSSKRRVICCEVLEHVETPERILDAIRTFAGPRGEAFITTVANIDAEDHVYLYHDAEHIRRMITECGFEVVQEKVLTLLRYATETVVPINYAAILRPIR